MFEQILKPGVQSQWRGPKRKPRWVRGFLLYPCEGVASVLSTQVESYGHRQPVACPTLANFIEVVSGLQDVPEG